MCTKNIFDPFHAGFSFKSNLFLSVLIWIAAQDSAAALVVIESGVVLSKKAESSSWNLVVWLDNSWEFGPSRLLDPGLCDAGSFDSRSIDPGLFDPSILESGLIDPGSFDSRILESGLFDPGSLDPRSLDPGSLDPDLLNPRLIDPVVFDPRGLDTEEFDPRRLDDTRFDPGVLGPGLISVIVYSSHLLPSYPSLQLHIPLELHEVSLVPAMSQLQARKILK